MQWIEALINLSAFAGFIGIAQAWPEQTWPEQAWTEQAWPEKRAAQNQHRDF
jgi:hypothetical protein